jgi:hypothetical protein
MCSLHSFLIDKTWSNTQVAQWVSAGENLGGVLGGDELGDLANGNGLALISAMQSVHTRTYSQ